MSGAKSSLVGRRRFVLALFGTLFVVSAGVSYVGTRDAWVVPPRPDESGSAHAVAEAEEVSFPPGPHRDEFQTACVLCHSPRLALNQPTFPEEKWAEIVHKMVSAYGAPVTKDDEARIVEYLLAAQTAR